MSEEDVPPERDVKTTKKNLGMEELMEWKHLEGKSGQKNPDWFLGGASKDISFIFWHETNT